MAVSVALVGVTPTNGAPYVASNNPTDYTAREYIVDFILTLTGNYGVAGGHGDPLNLTSFVDAVTQAVAGISFPFGEYAPSFWEIFELVQAGNAAPGYSYNYAPGPTLAAPTQQGGKLIVLGTGAASGDGGTEFTQGGAYANGTPSLANQQLKARFWFARL